MKRLLMVFVLFFMFYCQAWGAYEKSGIVYYPTDGDSAAALLVGIEAKGTPCTMKFIHTSGVSTPYKFPSGVTFPEYVTLEPENGAILVEDGGAIIIDNPSMINAGNEQQIFEDAITFTKGGKFYAKWWGFDSTDNTTHLNNAINSLPYGSTLDIGVDNFSLASASMAALGNDVFTIPNDGIHITCPTKWGTTITITGTSGCGIFFIRNKNDFTCSNISFIGNNESSSFSIPGTAIWWDNDSGTTDLFGLNVYDCKFKDFKGPGWIIGINYTEYNMGDIHIERNHFSGGEDRNPSNLGTAAHQTYFATTSTGYIQDAWVKDNQHYCNAIKMGISFQEYHRRVYISDNYVYGNGQDNSAEGAYGIMTYDGGEEVHITNNTVIDAYTCGMYILTPKGLTAIGNYVEGQEDTDDGTLPRGGISINGGQNINISGNILKDNYHAIDVACSGSTMSLDITGNTIRGTTAGIEISPSVYGECSGVNISNNSFTGNSTAIYFDTAGGSYKAYKTKISNNNFIEVSVGVRAVSTSRQDEMIITNNNIEASSYGLRIQASGVSYQITNNTIWGDCSSYGMYIQTIKDARITGNQFYDITTGKGLYTASTEGAFFGNQFSNVTIPIEATASEDLGLDTPTFSADDGTIIDRSEPSTPDGNSRYWFGWIMANGTWQQRWVSTATW